MFVVVWWQGSDHLVDSKVYHNLSRLGRVLTEFDPGEVQHAARGDELGQVMVLVTQVYHLGDTTLDDELGALIAREESHIHAAASHGRGILVQYRIDFCVHHIHVFGVELAAAFTRPWELVVTAACGEPVVADADNAIVRVDDTGADLSRRVLGPHGAEERHRHEVVVPGQVIRSLGPSTAPSCSCSSSRLHPGPLAACLISAALQGRGRPGRRCRGRHGRHASPR
mmetsp:Transcript_5977/g.17480  ORF Transcript_5977/g.17480 Transcript_5977/m.17480 type:complete len:226 (-) Transcript_5977:90-767(-)